MEKQSATITVELVDGTMYRIDLDRCCNVEACLLEPKAKSACSGKQVDTDRAHCGS
jgi:hypothetical protein